MMCFMNVPEYFFPVQQAVRPVVIGIVQNNHQQNAEYIVQVAIFIQRAINQRDIMVGCPPYRQYHQPEDNYGGE